MEIDAFQSVPTTAFTALALGPISASVSQDTEGRCATINAHWESGASLAKWTVCVRMVPAVTHSTANACAQEVGRVSTARRNAPLIDMVRTAVKSAVARTVEAATTFLASAIVPLVSQGLSAIVCVPLERMETNVSQSASVRTVACAIPRPVNVTVQLDGLVLYAQTAVQKDSGEEIVLKNANAIMEQVAIMLLESANVSLVIMAKSV